MSSTIIAIISIFVVGCIAILLAGYWGIKSIDSFSKR